MSKVKLYLGTSIPSAFYDTSKPLRQLMTQKWFEFEVENYELYTSGITIQEIEKIKTPLKKQNIRQLILTNNVHVLNISDEARKLAQIYIDKGAIPESEPEDALHVATAVVNKINSLASWNFKHIVSINPIRKIHEINISFGYQLIEIGSLELFGGYKYGNLY
jgi:predicted nucleic acid-binding protein